MTPEILMPFVAEMMRRTQEQQQLQQVLGNQPLQSDTGEDWRQLMPTAYALQQVPSPYVQPIEQLQQRYKELEESLKQPMQAAPLQLPVNREIALGALLAGLLGGGGGASLAGGFLQGGVQTAKERQQMEQRALEADRAFRQQQLLNTMEALASLQGFGALAEAEREKAAAAAEQTARLKAMEAREEARQFDLNHAIEQSKLRVMEAQLELGKSAERRAQANMKMEVVTAIKKPLLDAAVQSGDANLISEALADYAASVGDAVGMDPKDVLNLSDDLIRQIAGENKRNKEILEKKTQLELSRLESELAVAKAREAVEADPAVIEARKQVEILQRRLMEANISAARARAVSGGGGGGGDSSRRLPEWLAKIVDPTVIEHENKKNLEAETLSRITWLKQQVLEEERAAAKMPEDTKLLSNKEYMEQHEANARLHLQRAETYKDMIKQGRRLLMTLNPSKYLFEYGDTVQPFFNYSEGATDETVTDYANALLGRYGPTLGYKKFFEAWQRGGGRKGSEAERLWQDWWARKGAQLPRPTPPPTPAEKPNVAAAGGLVGAALGAVVPGASMVGGARAPRTTLPPGPVKQSPGILGGLPVLGTLQPTPPKSTAPAKKVDTGLGNIFGGAALGAVVPGARTAVGARAPQKTPPPAPVKRSFGILEDLPLLGKFQPTPPKSTAPVRKVDADLANILGGTVLEALAPGARMAASGKVYSPPEGKRRTRPYSTDVKILDIKRSSQGSTKKQPSNSGKKR